MRRGRAAGAMWALAASIVAGAALMALGPRALARDPEAVLRGAGWDGGAAADRQRIQRVVETFFAGFNAMLIEGTDGARRRCAEPEPLYRPFCHEGTAAGFLPRGYFRLGHGLGRAEETLSAAAPECRLLHYVGLGVWAGLRHGSDLEAASRLADGFKDVRGRNLFWNGYGFARSALHPEGGDPNLGPAVCQTLPAGAWGACTHGYGRGLWFRHAGDEAAALADCRAPQEGLWGACVSGVGLASTFVHPDRLERPLAVAGMLDAVDREAFLQGLRAALLVRHQADPELVEGAIASLPDSLKEEAQDQLRRALECFELTFPRDTFYDDFMACG